MRVAAARALALATRRPPPAAAFHASPRALQIEDVVRDPLPAPPLPPTPDPFLARPDVAAVARGPLALYAARRAAGSVRRDARQESAILELQRVYDDVTGGGASGARSGLTLMDAMPDGGGAAGDGWFASLFAGGDRGGAASASSASDAAPRGLYMYGGVGTGKTMLMDTFVEATAGVVKTRRVHFNDFMLDVHARLRARSRSRDPLAAVAADALADGGRVLALDELFVHDVADAAILARLFDALWAGGLVLVATSNRAPAALYEGGLQRDLFLPFIGALQTRCVVHDMASPVDYRRLAHAHRGLYFAPPDWPAPSDELAARFAEVAATPGCHDGDAPAPTPAPSTVTVMMGRTLPVPLAAGKAAFFPFGALCGEARGAADYIALADAFHTLALDGVPAFAAPTAAAAARFVALVDVMYDHRVRVFIAAADAPHALFEKVVSRAEAAGLGARLPSDAVVDDNLAFAKERTISRLIEMQSLDYLMDHARLHARVLLPALEEARARAGRVAGRKN